MRTCAFCGGTANSKEHAWPDWLLRLLSRGSVSSSIHAEREGEPAREWHGKEASVKVKRVCKKCNNEWMSDLETEALRLLEPLIMGQARDLDAREQLVVATWAAKTAMVFDLTRGHDRIHFSQGERECLLRARAQGGLGIPFPPHTWVWLAAYGGRHCSCHCHAVRLLGAGMERPSRRQEIIYGHVATISGGALVAQVLVTRLPQGTPNRAEFYYDACGAKWERAVVWIWPLLSNRVGRLRRHISMTAQ